MLQQDDAGLCAVRAAIRLDTSIPQYLESRFSHAGACVLAGRLHRSEVGVCQIPLSIDVAAQQRHASIPHSSGLILHIGLLQLWHKDLS